MRPNTLRLLRRYHLYLGLLFAPLLLLFTISGGLQTFRLNEPKGYGGTPPQWMVWFAAIHKNQAPPREPRAEKPRVAAMAGADEHADGHDDHDHDRAERRPDGPAGAEAKRPNPLPLKIFVVLLAIALTLSTVLGVVIALANRSTRRVSVVLLAVGTVLPIVLLWV